MGDASHAVPEKRMPHLCQGMAFLVGQLRSKVRILPSDNQFDTLGDALQISDTIVEPTLQRGV